MKLTDLQLECQRLGADTTLSFGCIIDTYLDNEEYSCDRVVLGTDGCIISTKYHSILDAEASRVVHGHPIDRGRLCYLYRSRSVQDRPESVYEPYNSIQLHFTYNPLFFQGNILTRPEDVLELVKEFLFSIQPCNQ